MDKFDYSSSYPNEGKRTHLTEEEYYWIKSYMSSIYGMTKAITEEIKKKFNEIHGKNGGKN